MKKFGKFIFTTVSLAAVAGGAVYFVKNILNKDSKDEFEDDFDDDFDDFDFDDAPKSADREYVTININDKAEQDKKEDEDTTETSETEDETSEEAAAEPETEIPSEEAENLSATDFEDSDIF